MKTITAKEFRANQSAIFKQVQAGQEYLLTSHRTPIARLIPIKVLKPQAKPPRSAYEKLVASLRYTSVATNLPDKPDYKAIRRAGLVKKYGR